MTKDNRAIAEAALQTANDHAGDTRPEDYGAAMALVGIGYALLALADGVKTVIELATLEKS